MQSLTILEKLAKGSSATLTVKVNARGTRVRWGYGEGARRGEELSGSDLTDLLDALLTHVVPSVGGHDG